MKRAVVTGMGIVSPLGNSIPETLDALRATRSGIKFQQSYQDMGLRSHIAGSIEIDQEALIDRKLRRFMGDAAAFSYIALREAIEDAALTTDQISNERTGIVAGSGGASSSNLTESADILREKGLKRVGPYRVTRTMSSTVSACLATAFAIKGINYSITSACSTSAHCIGHAVEQIQLGKQDIVFAGGGEEEHWSMTALFDAMGALSTKRNDEPETASRAFDADRDGFVIAGGAGFLIVEELEHARAAALKFMPKSQVTLRPQMALIWSRPVVREVSGR
jgi:3-oxoacyl-[acyl-carrier-protein] synthase-1